MRCGPSAAVLLERVGEGDVMEKDNTRPRVMPSRRDRRMMLGKVGALDLLSREIEETIGNGMGDTITLAQVWRKIRNNSYSPM